MPATNTRHAEACSRLRQLTEIISALEDPARIDHLAAMLALALDAELGAKSSIYAQAVIDDIHGKTKTVN